MRSLPFICVLTAAAFGLGCDGSPTQPAAVPDRPDALVVSNVVSRDFSDIAVNDCTGEPIPVVGHEHVLFTVTQEGVGTFHVGLHLDVSVKGTSLLTGASYIAIATENEHLTVAAGAEETLVLSIVFVGQGGVPNEVLHITFHITVLPDGTVTSLVDHFRILCQ